MNWRAFVKDTPNHIHTVKIKAEKQNITERFTGLSAANGFLRVPGTQAPAGEC